MLDISSSFISNAPNNSRAEWHFLLALCGYDREKYRKCILWKQGHYLMDRKKK